MIDLLHDVVGWPETENKHKGASRLPNATRFTHDDNIDDIMAPRPQPKLSSYERHALASVATLEGYGWKTCLRDMWITGEYPREIDYHEVATLQTLRNASYFGPKGLNDYRAPKA